jgi:hypothetical protein
MFVLLARVSDSNAPVPRSEIVSCPTVAPFSSPIRPPVVDAAGAAVVGDRHGEVAASEIDGQAVVAAIGAADVDAGRASARPTPMRHAEGRTADRTRRSSIAA